MRHASERDEAVRAAWWADTAQLDPARLVFVDERGTTLSLTPRDGRAPRSQRVVGGVPRTHGPNITLFAAMSGEGITAAMTMTGPAAGAVWELCVRQILVPSRRPGQIVSLDQLGVHQHRAVRQLIAVHGCHVRFLPPYSPDFSPIEHAFSTLTTALRHAGARTRPTREDAIATGLATITPHDAGAWFRHRGSALPEQLF